MDISRLHIVELPANGASTIEKDIVVVVEPTIRLARHIDGNLHQVSGTRIGIHLRQGAATIMIDTDLPRIDSRHIDAQCREIRSREFIDTRLLQTYLVPITTRHHRLRNKRSS